SAAVNSSSGVMHSILRRLLAKMQIAALGRSEVPKALAIGSLRRGTSQRLSNAKYSYPPQRFAKPAQDRNEINGMGPPPAGGMPFMSDSILNGLSGALDRKSVV